MRFFGPILVIMYLYTAAAFLEPTWFNMFLTFQWSFYTFLYLAVLAFIAIVESEDNEAVPVLPLIVGYIGLQHYHGTYNVIKYLIEYKQNIILAFLGYIFVGFIYTIPKMKFYLRKHRNSLKLGASPVDAFVNRFLENNKIRVYGWVVFWPFNFVNTLTSDVISELFNYIYERLGKVYYRIILSEVLSVNSLVTVKNKDGTVSYVGKSYVVDVEDDEKPAATEKRNPRQATRTSSVSS